MNKTWEWTVVLTPEVVGPPKVGLATMGPTHLWWCWPGVVIHLLNFEHRLLLNLADHLWSWPLSLAPRRIQHPLPSNSEKWTLWHALVFPWSMGITLNMSPLLSYTFYLHKTLDKGISENFKTFGPPLVSTFLDTLFKAERGQTLVWPNHVLASFKKVEFDFK